MRKQQNPLAKPLRKLMQVATVYQNIPGFSSDSLTQALQEGTAALKAEAEKNIKKVKTKTK